MGKISGCCPLVSYVWKNQICKKVLPIGFTVAHWSLLPIGLTHCISYIVYIPYSHFCKYLGPPTKKHTTFPNQGRDIYKSVNKGYETDNFKIKKLIISSVWKPDKKIILLIFFVFNFTPKFFVLYVIHSMYDVKNVNILYSTFSNAIGNIMRLIIAVKHTILVIIM
jgi:hypothetical protein